MHPDDTGSARPRPELLISVDVEASGPTPGTGSLISVGACLVTDPEVSFYREIRPIPEHPWDAETEAIHGLTRAHLDEAGRGPDEAMADFATWLREVADGQRPVFVGFNAPFDWMFVADYFHRFLGRNPFGISAIDLKSVYMGKHGIARWSETRRPDVLERYPIGRVADHNALADAQAQAELAQLLLDLPPA